MTSAGVFTYFRSHFSARIFLIFSLLVIVITTALTGLFFHYQSSFLTEKTRTKGELLASLFAYNAKLGVFTEDTRLLNESAGGILENEEVLAVTVYNGNGTLLVSRSRNVSNGPSAPATVAATFGESLRGANKYSHSAADGNSIVWTKVVLGNGASQEDLLYSGAQAAQEAEQVIGFVRLVLDGSLLKKSLHRLLLESILIGLLFLGIGAVVTYLFANRITHPLKMLTQGVNALGMAGDYQKITVDSCDEIGRLASAFNEMVDSLKNREAEKLELAEQLRHSQKMEAIGTLAGGVAHDFNNILTVIIGYGSLLKGEIVTGGKLESYAEQIIIAGERAASLTQRLLAFSRKQHLRPKPTALNDVVRNLEKMIVRLIPENVEMNFQFDESNPVVLIDSGQLDHVLINLVTNARDAMPEGGRLTIETSVMAGQSEQFALKEHEPTTDYAVLTVTDSGTGMDDATREKIFDPFFTTKEVGRGSGLGLSMVYGVVKQHEGLIEVESEPGRGAAFRIYLPLVDGPHAEPVVQMPKLPQGGKETILVAEDNEAVMGLLKGVLTDSGYTVIDAVNGEDAVTKFAASREQISLALLDVIMPKKNGQQVFDEIVKLKPDIKALFISGYTDNELVWHYADSNRVDLLSKPVQPGELLKKVYEALH
jgi:signal transduction histidine kinase/CheY-like chemotaxis protein